MKWGRWSDPSAQELDRLRLDNEEDYWREISIQWKLDRAMELIETHARENGDPNAWRYSALCSARFCRYVEQQGTIQHRPNGDLLSVQARLLIHSILSANFWGNPTYDWSAHQKSGYAWWKKRVEIATRRTPGIRNRPFHRS